MVEPSCVTERQHQGAWQFTLRSLFVLTLSVAMGVSLWKVEHDWYQSVLAALSPWIVLGLAAQVRDIWNSFSWSGELLPGERWGIRFDLAWRLAICLLIGTWFVIRVVVGSYPIPARAWDDDIVLVSCTQMWDALLIIAIISAVCGSLGLARGSHRRPWSWAVCVFRGFVATYLLLLLVDNLQIISYLVHITIVGILSALPLSFESDVVSAGSRGRINLFYGVTSAAVISLVVSSILLWQFSLRWRAARWQRVGVGVLLVASLAATVLLTTRIVLVEIPTISPVMAANIRMPRLLALAAAVLATSVAATVVARRWSEPAACAVAAKATWRREESRYYHERRTLLVLLGSVALAQCIVSEYRVFPWVFDWTDVFYPLTNPVGTVSFAVVLLTVHALFSSRSKHAGVIAAEQSQLMPQVFCVVWFAVILILLCSAPILGSWRFAAYLRSGFVPG
jgi:hypothetical protein